MPTVAFFPWLYLEAETPVSLADFKLFPVSGKEVSPTALLSVKASSILEVLKPYFRGSHHCRFVLLTPENGAIGDEWDDELRRRAFAFADQLAVAGLSRRELEGGHGYYSARGHYQLIIQNFPEPPTGHVAATHRRKEGSCTNTKSIAGSSYYIPEHLVSPVEAKIDEGLFFALDKFFSPNKGKLNGPIKRSMQQYLLANTDSPDVPLEIEAQATYAAFERLIDADPKLKSFQGKMWSTITPCISSPDCEILYKVLKVQNDDATLNQWFSSLYSLRGHCAHGKTMDAFRHRWTARDLLLSGAYLYPLVLKAFLQRGGHYQLTPSETLLLAGFPLLIKERPFFAPNPADDLEPINNWRHSIHQVERAELSISLYREVNKLKATPE